MINFSLPDNAVFEYVEPIGHDKKIKPTAGDSIRIEGDSAKGEMVEYVHVDEKEGKLVHELKQDVEPTLEWVKQQHSLYGSSAGKSSTGEWYHAARVPLVVLHAWLNARGLQMRDFKGDLIDRFLNDTDNSSFRVWQGRI